MIGLKTEKAKTLGSGCRRRGRTTITMKEKVWSVNEEIEERYLIIVLKFAWWLLQTSHVFV